MGCGRSLYQAVHDGLLPRFFEHTNRHGVPDYAMAFNLACSAVVVFIGSPARDLHLLQHGLSAECVPGPVRLLPVPATAPEYAAARCACPAFCATLPWPSALPSCSCGSTAVTTPPTSPWRPGKRWLFFLGLGVILLYLPLYAYRHCGRRED